jgi:hypothetical protein
MIEIKFVAERKTDKKREKEGEGWVWEGRRKAKKNEK